VAFEIARAFLEKFGGDTMREVAGAHARRVGVPQRLPGVGQADQRAVPLVREEHVVGDDREVGRSDDQVRLGVDDLARLHERVGGV